MNWVIKMLQNETKVFEVVDSINPDLDSFINQFYEENKELTRELENK